jgi:hypothetical protein
MTVGSNCLLGGWGDALNALAQGINEFLPLLCRAEGIIWYKNDASPL